MNRLSHQPAWRDDGAHFAVTTAANTDLRHATHYGSVRASGPFRRAGAPGDLTAEAAFGGAYRTLHDQAGLTVGLDERYWVAAGVGFVDGRRLLSRVVTRDFSDRLPIPAQGSSGAVRLWLRRVPPRVEWRSGAESGAGYKAPRPAHSPEGLASVGPMCRSPERGGFTAAFLLQVMVATGTKEMRLDQGPPHPSRSRA